MNKNAKVKPGRPSLFDTVKWPKGKFTVAKLKELNPNRAPLTLRGYIENAIKAKLIVKTKEVAETGAAGRPSFVYARKSGATAKSPKTPKTVTVTVPVATPTVATPEVVAEPAPATAEVTTAEVVA